MSKQSAFALLASISLVLGGAILRPWGIKPQARDGERVEDGAARSGAVMGSVTVEGGANPCAMQVTASSVRSEDSRTAYAARSLVQLLGVLPGVATEMARALEARDSESELVWSTYGEDSSTDAQREIQERLVVLDECTDREIRALLDAEQQELYGRLRHDGLIAGTATVSAAVE